MSKIRNLVAALAIAGSALVVATPDATPVQAATDYTCGLYKNYAAYPDYAFGSCKNSGIRVLSHRVVITCSPGNPVNQVTKYGNWVSSAAKGQSDSSIAYCTNANPVLLGAYMQTVHG